MTTKQLIVTILDFVVLAASLVALCVAFGWLAVICFGGAK